MPDDDFEVFEVLNTWHDQSERGTRLEITSTKLEYFCVTDFRMTHRFGEHNEQSCS